MADPSQDRIPPTRDLLSDPGFVDRRHDSGPLMLLFRIDMDTNASFQFQSNAKESA
jgi:hypothetical protein